MITTVITNVFLCPMEVSVDVDPDTKYISMAPVKVPFIFSQAPLSRQHMAYRTCSIALSSHFFLNLSYFIKIFNEFYFN